MKSRQAAIVKDLGRLLTKYTARDWQPLVQLLTSNPKLLFESISGVGTKSSQIKKRRSKRGAGSSSIASRVAQKRPRKAVKKPKLKVRKGLVASRGRDLEYRRVLSRASTNDLYVLYVQAYKDKQLPKSRSELTAALDKHLRRLSERARARALASLSAVRTDPTETFSRWVDIISKSARE